MAATVLVDGTVAATWQLTSDDGIARITVRPFSRLTGAAADEVEAEAWALLAFTHPEHAHEVELG